MSTFKAVYGLLSRRERWQLVLVLAFMLPNALMQVAGIASVMPFISVLAQPGMVESNAIVAMLHDAMGQPSMNRFLTILAVAALVLLILSNALAAATAWLIMRFSYMRVHSLSRKLLDWYLHSDYAFFLVRNPSDLTKNVINEVNQLVTGFLMPSLQLVANGAVVTAVLVTLIFIDPAVAIIVAVALGGAYGAVYLAFRHRVRSYGLRRLRANAKRFRTTHEAFGAIKDLKVTGREGFYLDAYTDASHAFARNQANHQVVSQMPRYALEAIAFGVILMIALYLTVTGNARESALPMIALYAMAGYRLMPALQKIFDNATTLRFATPVVERINEEIDYLRQKGAGDAPAETRERSTPDRGSVRLQDHLELQDVTYRYPGMAAPVLDRVNIRVPARSTVAFVGESGAGKSTLVDVILGLLEPEAGSIVVDGQRLDRNRMAEWRRHLGYVPQSIYLADDTLRHNIALGVPDREIDDEAVVASARMAAIHDFITHELPDGYDTMAGDRGIRLSGGQRQRIGVARALYNNPDLLILDEATSALDGSTEAAVIDAIERLSGEKTIIMIAHRLTTVERCDTLHFLQDGKVIASGTYTHLLATTPAFRRMATAAAEEADELPEATARR